MKIPKKIMNSPDDLCGYFADKGIKLKIQKMEEDDNFVLIEGQAEALAFLGHLLIAQSELQRDCSFFLSPKGPGRGLFDRKSDMGIYIHRLPCLEKKSKKGT